MSVNLDSSTPERRAIYHSLKRIRENGNVDNLRVEISQLGEIDREATLLFQNTQITYVNGGMEQKIPLLDPYELARKVDFDKFLSYSKKWSSQPVGRFGIAEVIVGNRMQPETLQRVTATKGRMLDKDTLELIYIVNAEHPDLIVPGGAPLDSVLPTFLNGSIAHRRRLNREWTMNTDEVLAVHIKRDQGFWITQWDDDVVFGWQSEFEKAKKD